jgi:hypothetical protein
MQGGKRTNNAKEENEKKKEDRRAKGVRDRQTN